MIEFLSCIFISHYLVNGLKKVFREFVYSEPNVLICLLTGLSVDVSGG